MSAAPVLEKANEDRIREIAREIAREQTEALRKEIMEGELGKLRRDLNLQMGQVWRAIGELTEAQKRTEARVEELAEAQKRTEKRVGRLEAVVQELIEAQKRTEERIGQMEAVVQELAEAQKRTEEEVKALVQAQQRLEQRVGRLEEKVDKIDARVERLEGKVDKIGVQVGRLAHQYGLELEADAAEVLYQVLTDKGYRFLEEPSGVSLNGEIDVVAHVETPDGQRLWGLVEAKARVRRKEVERWLKLLESEAFRKRLREQQGIEPPFLPYIYGQHVYRAAIQMAETAGLGVLDVEKERLSPRLWQ
ncbi:MAG: hypothetical protein GXP42_08105 [Chloroflexi bacterium]|nr:hypothetical protein [Chloroflexota bacterium]